MADTTTKTRPGFCTEEHLDYLDALRESAITNMFGARPFLMNAFPELSGGEALAVLKFWMHDDRHGKKTGGARP